MAGAQAVAIDDDRHLDAAALGQHDLDQSWKSAELTVTVRLLNSSHFARRSRRRLAGDGGSSTGS